MNSNTYSFVSKLKDVNFVIEEEQEPNFFVVAGFPHYENVVSNVLRYFFETNKEHNFGDMWLKSLLLAYNKKTKETLKDINGYNTSNIEREYSNGDDKRIDLLIDCDSLIIVIENKLYADLYNDLNIYNQMTDKYIQDNKKNNPTVIRIVLSLLPVKIDSATKFVNVTYEELFSEIESVSSQYQPNEKWLVLSNELITSLKQKEEVITMKSDKEWNNFVNSNSKEINRFLLKYESEARSRLEFLKAVNDEFSNYESNVSHGVYNYSGSNYMSQYVDIKVGNVTLVVETCLMKRPTGNKFEEYDKLRIFLWTRKNKHFKYDDVLKEIGREKIINDISKYHDTSSNPGGWGQHYCLEEYELNDNELDPKIIAEKINEYVDKIKKTTR